MKRKVLIALCMIVSSAARADMFDPQMTDICSPVPTPAHPGQINPMSLIGQLLKNQGVSDIDIEKMGADVSYKQKVDAVVSGPDYCARAGSHCSKDTKTKLDAAQEVLVLYIQRHQNTPSYGAGGYQFTFAVTTPNLNDFFLNPNSKLVPACIAGAAPAGAQPPPAAGNTARVPGRLVIRKNISDLTIAQTEDAFKSVQQATFAINADEVKKSTTYNIQGVIGYALGQAAIPSWPYAYAEFIPYIAYTGQFVHGNNPNKLTDVNNVGVGFLGDLLFPGSALQNALPFGRGIYNDVQASLEEVHSEISATDILSAKLTYTPFFDHNYLPGVGNSAPVGDYFITFTPQAVFIFGNVLDNGGNPNLSKTGNYQRLGAHLAFNVSAVAGIFNGFSFTTTYDYLRSYGGPVSDIALFTSTLSYAMPQQNLWSVQLQYQDGRNLDTLVQQKLITLGLGLKY